MEEAAIKLGQVLADCPITLPRVPVISNVHAAPYQAVDEVRSSLVRQMTAPVRWRETMTFLEAQDVEIVLDIGPKTILRDLSRANSILMTPFALDFDKDRQELEDRLFAPYFHFLKRALGVAVAEKNRNEDLEEYQRGVVRPYGRVRGIYRDIVEGERIAKPADARDAMNMLEQVFETKKVPADVWRERLEALLEETGLREFFASQGGGASHPDGEVNK
jgi:[acyl-carrier-protein] S-malonyltransferase